MISLLSPRTSFASGQVAFSVADRAQQGFPGLTFFTGDGVYIHGVRIFGLFYWSSCQQDEARFTASSLDITKSDIVPVKFSCLIKPLCSSPSGLFLASRQSGSGHHEGQWIGDTSLQGVNQQVIIMDFTSSLYEFEGYGVLIKVSIKLVHGEGVNILVSSVYYVSRDKGFFKGNVEFVDCYF